MARSAEMTTDWDVTVADALLFAMLGSVTAEETVAVLVMLPAVFAVTTMVAVAPALLARLPRLQVTVPVAREQVPWDDAADTKVTPAGRGSVRMTPVAAAGPPFM